jgi:hypothetical protein
LSKNTVLEEEKKKANNRGEREENWFFKLEKKGEKLIKKRVALHTKHTHT